MRAVMKVEDGKMKTGSIGSSLKQSRAFGKGARFNPPNHPVTEQPTRAPPLRRNRPAIRAADKNAVQNDERRSMAHIQSLQTFFAGARASERAMSDGSRPAGNGGAPAALT
jgi:hypothetical protein